MSLLLSLQVATLPLTGRSRTVERVLLTAALTFAVALTGTTREIERVRESSLTSRIPLHGSSRDVERAQGQPLNFVDLNVQSDKGSKRKPPLPPEYRWPIPTPEQPEPLADVVLQTQIQDVPLPKNPVLALALRKAAAKEAEKAVKPVKPVRHKAAKVVKDEKPIIDEDDDDFFFLT